MQNMSCDLAMQSCAMHLYVRCGTSDEIKKIIHIHEKKHTQKFSKQFFRVTTAFEDHKTSMVANCQNCSDNFQYIL